MSNIILIKNDTKVNLDTRQIETDMKSYSDYIVSLKTAWGNWDIILNFIYKIILSECGLNLDTAHVDKIA